jgi:hypothetical protein
MTSELGILNFIHCFLKFNIQAMDFKCCYFQYPPQQVIAMKSTWEYEQGPESSNLTGIISMVSPFDGYHRGTLISRIHVTNDWDITGAADMNLDTRKYTLILEGVV